MTQTLTDKNALIDQTIFRRTGVGSNELIKGWQSVLIRLLDHLGPHLQAAHIVTFQKLSTAEEKMYRHILQRVTVPKGVCGVYMPPSARNQIMYTNRGLDIPAAEITPKDDGVLLFSRQSSHSTILNVLLAHPPFTPAVDVYDRGAMLAGYVYDSIDDCLASMASIIDTHLGIRKGGANAKGPPI